MKFLMMVLSYSKGQEEGFAFNRPLKDLCWAKNQAFFGSHLLTNADQHRTFGLESLGLELFSLVIAFGNELTPSWSVFSQNFVFL